MQATRAIIRFLDGVDERRWHEDLMLRSAVMHQLTIVGEIARATSPELQRRHTTIPGRQIRAFRNLAVHEYFSVNWRRVWLIAQRDVPPLVEQAMEALRAEASDLAKQLESEQ